MSIHSDRLRAQSFVENAIGCTDLTHWGSYRKQLEEFEANDSFVFSLKQELMFDAQSLYERSLLSYVSALKSIVSNTIGWGLVKLYYSTFYSVRCTLAIRQHCLIRNKCWYHFDLANVGVRPNKLNGHEFRNDHDTAMNLYIRLFGAGDILLSNNIDGMNPFVWLMEIRNDSNYRSAKFSDPNWPLNLVNALGTKSFQELEKIWKSLRDDRLSVRAFQPDFAWLAIPAIQLRTATNEFKIRGVSWTNDGPLQAYISEMISGLPQGLLQDFYIPQ